MEDEFGMSLSSIFATMSYTLSTMSKMSFASPQFIFNKVVPVALFLHGNSIRSITGKGS